MYAVIKYWPYNWYATDFFGPRYKGDYSNGIKEGFGQFWWTSGPFSGDKYLGQFHKDRRHGHGQYVFSNGNSYEGNWVSGRQSGQGLIR